MKFLTIPVLLILGLGLGLARPGQPVAEDDSRMQWFRDARLGIFIHWGIYAVNGIDESWSFFNEYIAYDDYMKQLEGFTAQRFDPGEWSRLIKASGARYAVLTAKHHDGVALWDSKLGELNTVKKTPAGRDLVRPFVDALRKEGMKVGLYYSLSDWSHPDYPNFTKTRKRYDQDSERWERFCNFNLGQISELSHKYNPDLFWFDGDWEHDAEMWRAREIKDLIRKENPEVIVNSRLAGYGDYATPEQGLPITRPRSPVWELCLTINDSWGYQPNDRNHKTANEIIRIFTDCLHLGGNLLLDIGPREDGIIPPEQERVLLELGRWTSKHREAIFNSRGGIPLEYTQCPTTLSADGETLYLFLPYQPRGPVLVKGLMSRVARIRVVGNGTRLSHRIVGKQYWSERPGLLYIDVPETVLDPEVTVIALLLKEPIKLWKEKEE